MQTVSQKLIFSVEKLLNPSPADSLKSVEIPKTAPLLDGKALYNFAATKLESRQNYIKNLNASLEANYSILRKQVTPITRLLFTTVSKNSISFLNNIREDKLTETNLKFKNDLITSYSQASSTMFDTTDSAKFPENIIEFEATVIDDPSNDNYPDELPYLPIALKNRKTIFDSLKIFYALSFQDTLNIPETIWIPPQSEYLLIFPFVSVPVPPSVVRSGVTRVSYGTITTSTLLNFEIGRAE